MNISLWQRGGQGKTDYREFSFILIYTPSSLPCSHNANKTSSKQAERKEKRLNSPHADSHLGRQKEEGDQLPPSPLHHFSTCKTKGAQIHWSLERCFQTLPIDLCCPAVWWDPDEGHIPFQHILQVYGGSQPRETRGELHTVNPAASQVLTAPVPCYWRSEARVYSIIADWN